MPPRSAPRRRPPQRQSVEAAARRDREFEETLAEVLAGIAGSEGITAETQAVRGLVWGALACGWGALLQLLT